MVLDLILEGIPQSLQLIGYSINEYIQPHGRILQVYGESIKRYVGINGKTLVVSMMALHTLKFTWSSLEIMANKTYPLAFGFVGAILVLAANGCLIVSKMLALAVVFLTMPYLYYPVLAA